jgi:hypothetical protein
MKKIILALVVLISFSTLVFADTYVKGYTKKNGTYVEPHYRSSPDSNKFNNYSTEGNVNPYNGNQGRVDPYYTPPPSYEYKPYQYNNPYDLSN